MAAQPTSLADLIESIDPEDRLTLEDLLAEDPKLTSLDATIGLRVAFLKRIKRLNHIDHSQITFQVLDSEDQDPDAEKTQLLLDDPIADKQQVTAYLKKTLGTVQPCEGVPELVQAVADDAFEQKKDRNYVHYVLDQHLRIRISVGRVMPHADRDKDKAPDPLDEGVLIKDVDHRGHLYAANLAFDDEYANVFLNIIAEHGQVNVGAKKRFENFVVAYIKQHPNEVVHTIHMPYYKQGEGRPFAVSHYMVVNGTVAAAVTLYNPDG